MEQSGNLTLFFQNFTSVHFDKDPFLVPYYLGRLLNCSVTILYPKRTGVNLPKEYKGVKLLGFEVTESNSPRIRYCSILEYIKQNANRIKYLMLYFGYTDSEVFAKIYKKYNNKGKIYVKMDIDPSTIITLDDLPFWKRPFSYCKNKILRYSFLKRVDVASCEISEAYNKLRTGKVPFYGFGKKLLLAPNGIDEESIKSMGYTKSEFRHKENIFITVGRLGTYQKNTEMLLKALENVDLQDWKVYLIGTIDKEFESIKQSFIKNHPELDDKVIWAGPINNRKTLYDFYDRSKVFLLPSRYEGYAIVLAESQRFSNYIISTPSGPIKDIFAKCDCGEIIPNNDDKALSNAIKNVVCGKTNVDRYNSFDYTSLSWENRLTHVAQALKNSI